MENTIIIAGDNKYVWGMWLLLASMKKAGMREQVLVMGKDFSEHDSQILSQFGNVKIHHVSVDRISRNMTCYKPDAMMLADTEYITWVDCDGLFTGNVSELLVPENPEQIHIRVRDLNENNAVFAKYLAPGEKFGTIPESILNIWRNDVGENDKPALSTCCSACFLSLHRSHKGLLPKWKEQIIKVLPEGDSGVFDSRSKAYFQTDESVLNSLLCFGKNVPAPSHEFKLDKNPDALYIHFAFMPKPWQMWNRYNFRHFDFTVSLVEWAVASGYETPGPIPHTLKRKYRYVCAIESKMARYIIKAKKILKIR